MSKSNAFENAVLLNWYNNSAIANLGDATGVRGSTTAGSLYLAFHTADPGEAGTQSTSETAYTGYARKAIARSGAGFVVTANSVSPAADNDTGACTASPGSDITHFSIGVASSGAGMILHSGALGTAIGMAVGVTPLLAAGTTITED